MRITQRACYNANADSEVMGGGPEILYFQSNPNLYQCDWIVDHSSLFFSWSIIDQPCRDSFRNTPRWFSYKYTNIGSFFKFFSHLVIIEYWAVFSVLYSRSLLVIYFKIAMCPSTEKMVSLQAVQRCAVELQPTSRSLLQCCCAYTTGCASTPCWAFRILLLNEESSEFLCNN